MGGDNVMKIDKDFVVKFGEHTFRTNEIKKINISNGWFSMECVPINGMITKLETKLENVEFLNHANGTDEDTVEIIRRNIRGDEVKETVTAWVGDHKDDFEVVTPLKNTSEFGETVTEALNKLGEATKKLNEAMKIELSLGEKQFAKLIKKYNQDQGRRSGGD